MTTKAANVIMPNSHAAVPMPLFTYQYRAQCGRLDAGKSGVVETQTSVGLSGVKAPQILTN